MIGPLPRDIERGLADIVGPTHVITDPDRLVVYESDGLTSYRVRPRAVVLPGSTKEVAEAVRLLHSSDIEIVPRGAGTGLSGGALPTPDGVVLGTARMRQILEIDPENRLARIERSHS